MSSKFQASVQHRGDVSFVKLGGVIDEDNERGDLVDKIPDGTAVIDLGEIERINSCGVRDWVNWLSKLETNGTRSVLVECSPAIVAQINLVNNFTGNGVVKSFYVPYFCPECDEEKVLLVEATDMGPPPHEPPTCRCDECDLVMDFDDMPDSYFAFLSNQRKLAEPDKVNGDRHGPAAARTADLPLRRVRSGHGLRRHAGLVLRVPVQPAQARRARQGQRRSAWARRRTNRRPAAATSAIWSWTSTTCRTRTSRSCPTSASSPSPTRSTARCAISAAAPSPIAAAAARPARAPASPTCRAAPSRAYRRCRRSSAPARRCRRRWRRISPDRAASSHPAGR